MKRGFVTFSTQALLDVLGFPNGKVESVYQDFNDLRSGRVHIFLSGDELPDGAECVEGQLSKELDVEATAEQVCLGCGKSTIKLSWKVIG